MKDFTMKLIRAEFFFKHDMCNIVYCRMPSYSYVASTIIQKKQKLCSLKETSISSAI